MKKFLIAALIVLVFIVLGMIIMGVPTTNDTYIPTVMGAAELAVTNVREVGRVDGSSVYVFNYGDLECLQTKFISTVSSAGGAGLWCR